MQYIENKIKGNLHILKQLRNVTTNRITEVEYLKSGYKEHGTIPKSGWQPFNIEDCFSNIDEHYWFKMYVHTPSVNEGERVVFRLYTSKENQWAATNPQGLLYVNGKVTQALDTNHTEVLLEPDRDTELVCYYYTGMKNEKSYFIPHLAVTDGRIEGLYYDAVVPFEAAKLLGENEDRLNTLKHIEVALNMIRFNEGRSESFYDGIAAARRYLKTEFYDKECGCGKAEVSCIGHTHIDIAWLWTNAQTIEKAQRSFSTVLNLMKQYPEYKFMSSQAILYQFVKDYDPQMYSEIIERVKEGRWEVDGAMWLECDCNLSSGESMIRQIMYGKKFMIEEFGKDSKILWLPDTFGYSAAMPQILKKCGIDDFVTSKISWNDTNTIPHDTFLWEGIDGTEIMTHFMTAQDFVNYNANANRITTYVPILNPSFALGAWARYQDKEYSNRTMLTYGYGDGGGGPTAEMLEYQRRMEKGLPGIPKTCITTVKEHVEAADKSFYKNSELLGRTPRWVGELYLEFHRGTYTSIAEVKRNNRRAENAAAKTEFLSVLTAGLLNEDYPDKKLDDIWKLILLNQFHDVLPGSSIKEVYDDSRKQYEKVFEDCNEITGRNLDNIAKHINTSGGLLVYNSNYATESSAIKIDGKTAEVFDIPSYGWRVVDEEDALKCTVAVTENGIENSYYRLVFDKEGNIRSIFDKRNSREIVKENCRFNYFKVFEDYPRCYDNWEISEYYKCKSWELGKTESITPIKDGSRAGIKIVRKYLKSELVQTVWLYSKLDRIDFETEIDWYEQHQLLKVFFPINVHTNKAVYDIQFGNVGRTTHQNTSWDSAKFEVCAHKWADVSDGNYGVSIMNDCKYGYSCIGSELSLTLLKCGTYPNTVADQGKQTFTYSVLPHKGNFRTVTVPRSYVLNRPFDVLKLKKQNGNMPESFSFVCADKANAVIETVKRSEDGKGTILRVFDCYDVLETVNLRFGTDIRKAYICDMLENEILELPVSNNVIRLKLKNYEIVTIKVLE